MLSSALNSAVKSKRLAHSPIEHVELPRIKSRLVKPYVWTAERVQRWQGTGKAPGPVMVWTPAQTGAFPDFAADEQAKPSVSPNVISLADRHRGRTEHAR
ncbi:hypothetical protein ABZ806_23975 [Spirillospora sp. NPDC047418]